ncbi:MAG: hypothetical protein ABSG78_11280 [Verrucomicrobiota bacterium]|jgi:hypothetical protein
MAQVYNQPLVGFVNIATPQGYSLLTAPLLIYNQTNQDFNEVADIFHAFGTGAGPGSQNGLTVFTMDGSGFKANNYLNGWTDPGMVLLPGAAWFFKNPYIDTNPYIRYYSTLTIAGMIADGTNQLPAGFSACGSTVGLLAGKLTSQLMFPTTNGDQVFTFNNSNNTYSVYTFSNNNWLPGEPSIAACQPFWVNKTIAADWVQDLSDPSDPNAYYNLFVTQPELTSQTGQLNFFTFNAADSGAGQVMDTAGNLLSTSGLGQLYAGTNANDRAFVPLARPVSFSANLPGYISSGVVSIPFVAGGQTVYVQLRAWQQADGASFEQASARGAPVGISSTMTLTAHATIEGNEPGIPPPDVNAFPSFQLAVLPPAPPVQIHSPSLSGTNLTFSFASASTRYYVLWTCTDLTTMNWVPGTFFVGTGSPIKVSLPVANSTPQQFFWVQAIAIPD